ncbi:sensor histidine kinase [Anabaena sp. CS-542/02]|uniref:sensor histidine kinase n=1 Tax=Anabaena sp. CS-542/02 TaxID=3021719 RepID=UPI00232CD78D|nr:PAS domain-containing sensor histidine kinase [Anabaena sp. CS-542/02]MDB9446524.1 ATP-binding protein [Anabaena sp. CS-542/02]
MDSREHSLFFTNFSINIQAQIDLKFAYFLIDQAVEPAFYLGENYQFIFVNNGICKMTEYSSEELLSMRLYHLGTERSLIGVVTKLDGMLKLPGKPGELIIAVDITDYKNLESSLNNALEQAKQLSELRAQFLSMVCHQLRTPLNIISFCNSLVAEEIDKHTKKKIESLLENIEKAIAQISQMLDDTLLFAQAESAKINFDPKPLDLLKFCHNLVEEMHMSMSEKRINFVSKVELINAFFDAKLLDYILKNILGNAIKYSPKNSRIDFIINYQGKYIIFKVKDQGIGIPITDQKRLFEAFYRGSNIGNIPGNGLGLSIIKTLVDLHGGQVNLESEVDKGTTITVMLPLFKEASSLSGLECSD